MNKSICVVLAALAFISVFSITSGEPLTSASVSEGACKSDDNIKGATNVNTAWVLGTRLYNIVMGSESMFRGYFEVLKGRPAESEEELASLKPKFQHLGATIFNTSGFDSPDTIYIKQVCPATFLNQFLCFAQSYTYLSPLGLPITIEVPLSSSGTDTSGIITSRDTIMETDNSSYAFIVRCLNNTVQDWKLVTTSPTLPDDLRQKAANKATALGFNPANFRVMQF